MAIGQEVWREHAEQVGRVTLAWNGAVLQLLRVFSHLTGIGSPLAEALFFSHKTDRGQRELIKSLAMTLDLKEADRRELKAILHALDEVSVGRNLAAHTIFGVSLVDPKTGAWGARVVPALDPPQDRRLEADFTAQFQVVETSLEDLQQRLETWLIRTPFPKRQWGGPPFLGPPPKG